jgi:hypothetical protein
LSTTPAYATVPDLGAMCLRVPASVVFRAFPAETVALNLATGQYQGLNPVAGRMLELLARTGSMRSTAQQIATEACRPVGEVEGELRELCVELLQRDLLEVADARGR